MHYNANVRISNIYNFFSMCLYVNSPMVYSTLTTTICQYNTTIHSGFKGLPTGKYSQNYIPRFLTMLNRPLLQHSVGYSQKIMVVCLGHWYSNCEFQVLHLWQCKMHTRIFVWKSWTYVWMRLFSNWSPNVFAQTFMGLMMIAMMS